MEGKRQNFDHLARSHQRQATTSWSAQPFDARTFWAAQQRNRPAPGRIGEQASGYTQAPTGSAINNFHLHRPLFPPSQSHDSLSPPRRTSSPSASLAGAPFFLLLAGYGAVGIRNSIDWLLNIQYSLSPRRPLSGQPQIRRAAAAPPPASICDVPSSRTACCYPLVWSPHVGLLAT
jgi:hypothetical protein